MGLCASQSAEDKTASQESHRMDQVLVHKQEEEERVIKLLLLGTGESGKSTIFKQMQIIYLEDGFSDYEKATYRLVARRNILESAQALVAGCERFNIPFQHADSAAASRHLTGIDSAHADFWSDELVPAIKHLWSSEPAVKEMYRLRAQIQLIDSASYFFENIDRIGKPDYAPTRDDILRARLRTSGIVERTFRIGAVDFKFLDVGGQRNERRKWIHCFEDVTAVMFVAAISEYDQMLYEDEKENRMHETLKVFDNIINTPVFKNSTIILFLNKQDLFDDKLKSVPLTVCFPDYKGTGTFDDASAYIQDKFLQCNQSKRLIFPHLTCATDTTNVGKVFEACKLTILNQNLKKLGLDTT